jgi:hypothetical protein
VARRARRTVGRLGDQLTRLAERNHADRLELAVDHERRNGAYAQLAREDLSFGLREVEHRVLNVLLLGDLAPHRLGGRAGRAPVGNEQLDAHRHSVQRMQSTS